MRTTLILSALVLIACSPTAAAFVRGPANDVPEVPIVPICALLAGIICDTLCDPPEATYGDSPVANHKEYGIGIGGPARNGGHDGAFGPYYYIGCR